jgi:hypothetical protein
MALTHTSRHSTLVLGRNLYIAANNKRRKTHGDHKDYCV